MVLPSRSVLLVLGFTLLIFLPALRGTFLGYDDELLVLDNPKVHGLSLENVVQAFTTFDPELYVPLTLLTYQAEWSLVQDDPWLYHATNITLHLAATGLVFLIARRFFDERVSVLCALLFAVHPVQVEAVAWVSGRKDLLASMLFLASVHGYLRWREEGKGKLLSVLLFALGLLAKVSIFPLPVVLLLLDHLDGRCVTWQDVKQKWPYFSLSAVFLTIALLGKEAQVMTNLTSTLLLSFASIPLSFFHLLYPVGLTIFYPFTDAVSILHPRIISGIVMLAVLLSVVWLRRKQWPALWFAVLWFLLLIAPSLLNMQRGGELGVPDIYLTSDRYTYLAILGPVIALGFLLRRVKHASWFAMPALATLMLLTVYQINTWHDSESLFRRVVDTGQPAHVAYTNLGSTVAQAGELEEAETLYERSLAIRRTSRGLYNLIQIKGKLGKKDDARALYDEYVALRPAERDMHVFLEKFTR